MALVHRIVRRVLQSACLIGIAASASAQGTATISGVVKDTSGAVIPGVTAEASSPALIEKVRTVVTDTAGQYKIVSLPSGTYKVSFSLTGFNTVTRDGIELTTGFTATVNGELKVGAVEETINVSGDAPVVDVQSVKRQVVMTRDIVDALPTGKTAVEVATLIPGVQLMNGTGTGAAATGMGGSLGMDQFATLAAHGGRPADSRTEINGVNINIFGQRQDSSYANFQDGNVQEYAFEFSANSAETETGGVRINVIHKDGGNTFSGQFFANFSNNSFLSDNVTDALRATGLRDPDKTKSLWTVNPSIGGPLMKNKLWFYGAFSRMVNERYKAGTYFSTDLAAWKPSFTGAQATAAERTYDASARLTWQASPRNKITVYYDYNRLCQCPYLIGATYVGINAPEGATLAPRTTNLPQVLWTAPLTSRVLIEAAFSSPRYTKGHAPYVDPVAPRITESTTGVSFRAPNPSLYFTDLNKVPTIKGAVSYVTGTHAVKVGSTLRIAHAEDTYEVFQNITYTTLNYRPVSVSYQATPYFPKADESNLGLFAQDQWTLRKLTLNLGLRFDYYKQGYPDLHEPATQYVLTARDFPATTLVSWKDLSPRLGVAYDVFGNGKTAVKASLSRFVIGGLYLNDQNPARSNVTMTRSWSNQSGDFIIHGDPFNPAQNGDLGPSTNLNFGKAVNPYNFAPDYAFGLGVRPYNWEASAGFQHELLPRVSVNASYFHRWFGNFQVNHNTLVSPSDFSSFCVTVPNDPRLPVAGQQLCGLYDINPDKLGQIANITTSSSHYGNQIEHWDGIDLSSLARLTRGIILQGGLSTGRTSTDNCEIVTQLPELLAPPLSTTGYQAKQFCRQETPFLTQVKFGGSYTLPFNIQIAGTVQSFIGTTVNANATYTNAQIFPSLGRNLSGATTGTINVVTPNTLFVPRLTQLDLRFSKILKSNRIRYKGMVDIFNVGNINTVTGVNNTYGTTGAAWFVPTSISLARLVKLGVQMDF